MRTILMAAAVSLMPMSAAADESEAGLAELKRSASNMPSGRLNIPNQWFLMKSVIGWEEMMLIFGYADNKSICEHLVVIAREENPSRDYACLDAN